MINIKSSPFKPLGNDDHVKVRKGTDEEEKDQKPKEYRVNGHKIKDTILTSQEDIAVQISDPQWHDDGFFSAKYVTFLVRTPSLGYEVRRKDKDFNQFQEYLEKVYPHILVPTIPEFQRDRKGSQKYWERRAREMQTFVNQCLQSSDLKSCPLFMDFIKNKDFKAFSKLLKNQFDKHFKPIGTKDLYTNSGFHTIDANPSILEFTDKLPAFLSLYETTHSKFHHLSRKLTDQFYEISRTCKELSE